eukprot:tig00021319_g20232.t1
MVLHALLIGSVFFPYSLVQVPVPAHMLLVSCACIYIGAHKSVHVPEEQKAESVVQESDAYKFPLIASCALFGLYVLFKLFSPDLINLLLTAYIIVIGVIAFAGASATVFDYVLPDAVYERRIEGCIPIPFWRSKPGSSGIQFSTTPGDLLRWIFAVAFSAWYVAKKHWTANNLFGMAFCIQGIEMISLGSFKVGLILLCGLFFYDIFWVFGTDVMVTVAKKFDAPIKFLFPRDLLAAPPQFNMLGLGDVVIPGVFIALLLRMDVHRALAKPRGGAKDKTKDENEKSKDKLKDKSKESLKDEAASHISALGPSLNGLPKPYFYTVFGGYVAGLVATVAIMNFFKAAQPALLYLVPCCLGSVLLLAAIRGELNAVLSYSDMDDGSPAKGSE